MQRVPVWLILLMLALAPEAGAEETCAVPEGMGILVSPRTPSVDRPLRVLVATTTPLTDAWLEVQGENALHLAPAGGFGGEYLHTRAGQGTPADTGTYRVVVRTREATLGCRAFTVAAKPGRPPRSRRVWEVTRAWDRETELLFAAWVQHLFDYSEGASWPDLKSITIDPRRNLLHDHFGAGEDAEQGRNAFKLRPDCADNPFYLRAYFAWKLGLPFGVHKCSRGNRRHPPRCDRFATNLDSRPRGSFGYSFYRFLRKVKSYIHSGSARTEFTDSHSDLYPLPLERAALLPGTVYADPFGHTLTLVRWVPQTDHQPGRLLAVDAQPDGTVTIKRFWRGNFLFTHDGVIGDPGFKWYRPLQARKGRLVALDNAAVAAHPDYGNYSPQQAEMTPQEFYDRMARLINPRPLDPEHSLRQLVEALHEQILTRVTAIANGDQWVARHPRQTIAMPAGVAIFQTSGPWEDYSTPARDMRLLIALDTVLDFPDRVVRMPDAFRLPDDATPATVRDRLRERLDEWAAAYNLTYRRSDGSVHALTMADLFNRIEALEMGYNPNDCPEIRWGAPKGSDERATCNRQAPRAQRKHMRKYRDWFKTRRRPSW